MKTSLHINRLLVNALVVVLFFSVLSAQAQSGSSPKTAGKPAPELVFRNPVLVSGTSLKEGAVYRFKNVVTDVDAEIKLKKFSSTSVVMRNIDLATAGWDKAFQPEFGIPGNVPANREWWIDFEMVFYKAGTTKKTKIDRFDVTTLDVDGDGASIREFIKMQRADSVKYSPLSYLTQQPIAATTPQTCGECGKTSPLEVCSNCKGAGKVDNKKCDNCNGTGKLYSECDHAWDKSIDVDVLGPKQNFNSIDTAASEVMATYVYLNKDGVNFRMGARSGSTVSNAGMRLNSFWFKSFSLAPPVTLPVTLTSFSAQYQQKDVVLTWNTATEEDFSHFVIERSADGKEFADVALVFSNGGRNAQAEYMFKDKKATSATGKLYYRLRMVDQNTKVAYSAIRIIKTSSDAVASVSVFPNPATDMVQVMISNAWQGKQVQLELFDGSGSRVRSLLVKSAGQIEPINLQQLGKGVYFLKASCGAEMATQRILKN